MVTSAQEYLNQLLARRAGTTGGPGEIATSINRGLGELGRESGENDGGGGGLLGEGLSVLGRGLDLISRPLYGVAEGANELVQNAKEGKNPLDILQEVGEGVAGGIAGKEKTTFSKVLESAGVENDLARGVGGFALDVLLDPTTYIGAGVVKQVSEEALKTVGARAAKEATESVVTKTLAKKAAKEAREDLIFSKQIGQKLTSKDFSDASKGAFEKIIEDAGYEAALSAKSKALQEAPGVVKLKIAGREIGQGSEKLYQAGRGLAGVVAHSRVGSAFNKAFRPSATFVAGTNDTRRMIDSVGMNSASFLGNLWTKGGRIAEFDGQERAIQALKDLTVDERRQVFDAIDRNALDALGDPKLAKAAEDWQYLGERFHAIEASLGIRDIDDYLDNYVHFNFDRTIRGNEDDLIKMFEQGRKQESVKLRKADQAWQKKIRADMKKAGKSEAEINTFVANNRPKRISTWNAEKARELGLTPETDLANMVGNRIHKHYRATSQAAFARALKEEFGVSGLTESVAQKLGLVKSSSKYLGEDDVFFPREIEKAIKKHNEFFFSNPEAGSELVKLYDETLGKLKFLQTVVNPGHHIRNFFGDMTTGALDGLVSAKPYFQAESILRSVGKDHASLQAGVELGHVFGDEASSQVVKIAGQDITGDRMFNFFANSGAKSGMFRSEIMEGNGRITSKLREISEQREDITRLAHFIHAMDDEAKKIKPALKGRHSAKQLETAAQRASQRVRKYKFDYGDLTPFEQRVMKRWVPFYTFMRKNTPMQVESLFMRPGRQVVQPKLIQNLQVALGEDEDIDILGLNALPDYMRQAMVVNLIGEGQGRNGVYWNPTTVSPLLGIDRYLGEGDSLGDIAGSILEGQLSGITPAAQIPLQQITGHNFFTGRPSSQSLTDQLINLIPAGRYTGEIGSENNSETLDLLNWLTGAGISQVHPGMVSGELRRQEDIIQDLLRRQREQEQ